MTENSGVLKMRGAIALTAILLASRALAQDLPAPHSFWRGTQAVRQNGQNQPWESCLEIIGPLSPLSEGSNVASRCVQISGVLNSSTIGGLFTGYACPDRHQFNFFIGVGSDNSLGPDIFLGSYGYDSISGSYFVRTNNDPNASYEDVLGLEWHSAPECRQ
jgi:hypothetical protein